MSNTVGPPNANYWTKPYNGACSHDLLACFDINDLIMSSAAYYLGRRTAMVDDFCKRLIKAWPLLTDDVKAYVQRLVEEQFTREDTIRKNMQPDWTPFGDNCDRESWLAVRKCWAQQ